jgi:hypothetical protein
LGKVSLHAVRQFACFQGMKNKCLLYPNLGKVGWLKSQDIKGEAAEFLLQTLDKKGSGVFWLLQR